MIYDWLVVDGGEGKRGESRRVRGSNQNMVISGVFVFVDERVWRAYTKRSQEDIYII